MNPNRDGYTFLVMIRLWLVLLRMFPCGTAGLLGVMGYEVASAPRAVFSIRLCSVFAFNFLAYASANIINDIMDYDTDAIQHPMRPLPSGRISTNAAWVAFTCTVVAAIISASFFGWKTLLGIVCVVAIGILYSSWLKSTVLLGNATVAFTAALALPIGAIAHGALSIEILLAYSLIALFMFSFEILKTIRDRHGDEAAGYRTVAVVWGERKSILVLRACMSGLIVLSLLPVVFQAEWLWGLLLSLGVVLPSTIMVYRLSLSPAARDIAITLKAMTIAWIPGILTIGAWLWEVRGS